MASIIKNQILKHLSKFTKNLSQDKINLSTFKGEGELSNLELDEVILMDLLDLPTWMKLSKAVCNRLSIKIQWTKLKSKPICIYLDEVVLEVETCDPPRPPNNPAHMASYRTVGKYGFIDRVIDGIYVHINSVSAKFISRKFHATLQLSRVKVHSVTPIWKPSDELGSTKIRDSERGEILLFKEVDWQTTRIEATAVEGESSKEFVTTPLRFIANQSKIRITIKKKLSDCSIIATRVMLLLDDLLWVLTDTQLKAAIHYITSLRDLIDKSRQQSKNLAAEKLHIQGQSSQYADLQQQHSQRPRSQTNSSISSMFTKFDVSTTSYHVISSRIDLHLCDDSIPNSVKIPKHNNLIEGGAMQISFFKLSLDIYPFNPAGGERKSWHRYMDNQGSRNYWVQQLFAAFKQEVSKARNTCKIVSPSQSPSHTVASLKKSEAMQNEAKHAPPSPRQGRQHDAPHTRRSTKLLESCYVLKIEEFTIFQVTTADNKRNSPKKFLSSDKKQLHLPSDMSVIHAEYTDYFFPEGIDFPVPHANLYVLLNPVCVNVDWLTMLWMNYFMLNLAQSLGNIEIEDTSLPHLDMKVEAIMPRVIVPGEEKMDSNPERPEGIQLQISKISATNTHVEDNTTSKELSSVIDSYSKASLFTSNQFPNENNPLSAIPPNFSSHAQGTENPYLDKLAKCLVDGKVQDVVIGERKDILKTKTLTKDASYDIWVVITEQVWLEFLGSISSKCRPSPFVESIPITLWLCKSSSEVKPTKRGSQDKTKSDSMSCKDIKVENDNEQIYVETENDPDQNSPERQNRRAHKLLKEFYVVENSSEDVPVGNSLEESTREHLQDSDELHQRSHREAYCDKLRFSAMGSSCDPAGNVQYSACHAASFNLLAKIGPGRIKAQMTHFQYIMTMGLLESFTKFQEQMNADVTYFLGDSSPPLTFSVPLVVPEIEIAMICPYTAELPPFDSPFSPSAISAHDDDMEDESQDKCISNYSNEKEDSEDATLTDDKQSSSTTVDCLYTISKSQSDSGIHSHLPTSNDVIGLGDQDMDKNVLARNSLSSQTLSSVESVNLSQGLVSFSAMASESGYSSTSSSRSRNQQMAGGKSGSKATDHMKKFTSKMSGLADKLKAKIDSKGDDGISDDSETMSIRTDLSDEDTDFEMLSLDDGDSPIFQHHRTSETASISTDTDAMEDFSSFFADNSSKAQDMVSVILFKLYHGEVCLQGDGNKVSARIQAKSLLTSQPGNMLYEDFHAKFDSQSGFLQAEDGPFGNSYAVKMKFTGPSTETEDEKDSEGKGFLQVKAQDCGLRFTLSSLTNLTNFVEDESVGEALPMHIDVNNFSLILQIKPINHFILKEDRPSSDTTVGGPVAVPEPIQLSIHQLTITRGGDGIFHLRGGGLEPMDTLICNADPEIIQTAENNIEEVPTKGDNFDKVNSTQEISTNKIKSKLVTALTELQQAKQQKQLSDMKAMVSQTKLETAVTELQQIKQEKQKLQEMINDMNSKLEQLENLKFENRSLQEQMKKFAYSSPNELEEARDLKTQNEMYITENLKLIEKVSHLEDEVISLNREKTSLVDTLKLLQDELNFSERRRHNSTSDSK